MEGEGKGPAAYVHGDTHSGVAVALLGQTVPLRRGLEEGRAGAFFESGQWRRVRPAGG